MGSPVYWKTRSELVYHGSDLYHCDHASTMSPPPPQSIHDYGCMPLPSDTKTSPFTATFSSPHLLHLRQNHLLDYPGKHIDDSNTPVDHSKCQQQEQLDHCTALKLKRDHVYELPRVQDKVRHMAAEITCPGDDTQGQGGGDEYPQRQGTCTERNALHAVTCM